jgi:hypothetical protein
MENTRLLFILKNFHVLGGATFALLMLCATASASAQSCAGLSLGNNASLNGFVPFPASNIWNTNIAAAPVDPNSAAITSASGFAGLHLHPDFGSESNYGIPYVVVDSTSAPSVPINVLDYAPQSDVVVAPFPVSAPIEGNPADCSGWPDTYVGDSHVLVLDRATCFLYETYNTHRCGGIYNASSETIWDMNNYETRPWGWTSADAAGLPIFPGLVRYDEIASGAINHAIRFTMAQTKDDNNNGYFVYPATHASGNLWGSSNVMGMRIRLKASFDISGFSAVNQVILTAMKQYGMILADNGGYFFFQGVSDPRFDDNDLANLSSIDSSNFEVVQATPEFPGYDAGTAPTGLLPVINSFTVSGNSIVTGTPVTFTYNVSGDSYDFIDIIGPVAAGSGSVTINPTTTQTYTLNPTNAYGRTTSTSLTVSVYSSAAAAPVFSLATGVYTLSQTVTLSDTTPGALIYYTTNNTTPTTSSTIYTGAITVSSSETIQAIAVAPGYANSAVNSAAYTITQATPTITWPTPADISYGTALSATQLNASSTVAGTYAYSPAAGTVLTAGPHTLSVIFTPTDTTDYTASMATVTLIVNQAPLAVIANNTSRAVGAANPTFTASYSGFVNGDTTAVLSGSPSLTTTATISSPVGPYPITAAVGTLTANNYSFTFINGTLVVAPAPTVVITTTAIVSGSSTAGYTATITVQNTGTGPANNVTLNTGTLGSATGSPLPQTWGTIAAGGSGSFTVNYPGSAGADGVGVSEKYSGTYTGGSFSASIRSVTLP